MKILSATSASKPDSWTTKCLLWTKPGPVCASSFVWQTEFELRPDTLFPASVGENSRGGTSMVRVIIAALLATIVLFLWGFVFWTKLPTSKEMLAPLMNGEAVAQEVLKSNAKTGVYFYPGSATADDDAAREALTEKLKSG